MFRSMIASYNPPTTDLLFLCKNRLKDVKLANKKYLGSVCDIEDMERHLHLRKLYEKCKYALKFNLYAVASIPFCCCMNKSTSHVSFFCLFSCHLNFLTNIYPVYKYHDSHQSYFADKDEQMK